jgi:RNA polymerase sigma-70 factor, ECF subfamily
MKRDMGRTDEDLVQQCLEGDSSAFDLLVERWERKIRGAVFRMVGSDDEARDVTQEAFLKAYRGLSSFKKEARFSSWLYQIALNLCRDRARRRRGRPMVSLDDLDEGGVSLRELGPSALDMLEELDLGRLVAKAVAMLPEEQREVVVLKEYEGLTFLEIAQVLGIPVSTVKTRLYRALGQLKVRLVRQGVRRPMGVPAPTPTT